VRQSVRYLRGVRQPPCGLAAFHPNALSSAVCQQTCWSICGLPRQCRHRPGSRPDREAAARRLRQLLRAVGRNLQRWRVKFRTRGTGGLSRQCRAGCAVVDTEEAAGFVAAGAVLSTDHRSILKRKNHPHRRHRQAAVAFESHARGLRVMELLIYHAV
jgi:hypothetical protein